MPVEVVNDGQINEGKMATILGSGIAAAVALL